MHRPVLVLALAALLQVTAKGAQPPSTPQADVLIVHDSAASSAPAGLVDGNNVLDLLGHFGLKGRLVAIEEYKPGDCNRYKYIIVLGVDDRPVTYPQFFLSDIRATQTPVFWIYRHLSELFAQPGFAARMGFQPVPGLPFTDFTTVNYKGESLVKSEGYLVPLNILDNSKVQVIATSLNSSEISKPYIVRSGSFWYCADSPFSYNTEGDRYLVFCDLLHDFFKIPHQEERKALVRIEDVSVDDDNKRFASDCRPSARSSHSVSNQPDSHIPRHDPQYVSAGHLFVGQAGICPNNPLHGFTRRAGGHAWRLSSEPWPQRGRLRILGRPFEQADPG